MSRLRFIGDIVLTTPVIEVLHERFAESEIDYLGDKDGVLLLRNNPNLRGIIPYDFESNEISEQLKVGAALRRKKYDIAIDLFGNPRSALVIRFSGAKMRIGGSFGWRKRMYTHPVEIHDRMSAVEFHLKYLEPLGIHEKWRTPKIFLTDVERKKSSEFLEDAGVGREELLVGFQLGATWPAKVWPPERFAQLAGLIESGLGGRILLTYGHKDRGYLDRFLESAQTRTLVIHPEIPNDLRKLAGVVSMCDTFVSNDTSTMHISAAVGVPTIGIFGPSDPGVWFPYARSLGHEGVRKEVGCCGRDACLYSGNDYMRCMSAITADEIFELVKKNLMKGKRIRP